MADLKSWDFQLPRFSIFFCQNVRIGPWVGRIDWCEGLNLYGWETVLCKLKNRKKNAFFVFLGCFWAYVGQPKDHMGWATSMFFKLIILEIFTIFFWKLAVLQISVFLSRPFWKKQDWKRVSDLNREFKYFSIINGRQRPKLQIPDFIKLKKKLHIC
jgi:hypothetical protein